MFARLESTYLMKIRPLKNIHSFVVLILSVLSFPALAGISLHTEYHRPTDLFAIMDETALWYEGFNDTAYREYWTDRFGWTEEDQTMADRYRGYRERTFDNSDQGDRSQRLEVDGIFSTRSSVSENADPLFRHFGSAETIDAALSTFDEIAQPEDAQVLQEFYAHFRPGWELLLAESAAFKDQVGPLRADLRTPKVAAHLSRIASFYKDTETRAFRVRLVWWPPIDRTFAYIKGNSFLLYRHPERHAEETGRTEIVMHEVVHYISAHQPSAQKRELSAQFLEICPAEIRNLYHLLEEPLAVAWGQAAFTKYGRGLEPDPSENWYRPPMPDVLGRLLWPHIDEIYETEETITDGIVPIAATYCARLLEIGDQVKRQE